MKISNVPRHFKNFPNSRILRFNEIFHMGYGSMRSRHPGIRENEAKVESINEHLIFNT